MDEAVRVLVALAGAYIVVRGGLRLRRLWQREPTESRLLWLILVLSGGVAVLANVSAILRGTALLSATYASTLPIMLGVVIVTLPDRYRASKAR